MNEIKKTPNSKGSISIHDLKCGNILKYDTAEGEILPTVIDWQALKWLTEDPKGFNLVYSPIALTEDLLVKFGFKKSLKDTYQIIINGMEMYINYNNGIVLLNIPNNNNIVIIPKMMKHVHELQNSFYGLTGVMLSLS